MRAAIFCIFTLVSFTFTVRADDSTPSQISTPPFFKIAAHASVDNAKGATIKVEDKDRLAGASITIPAGALTNENEDVVLSYSEKPPGLPEKPGNGMSFVQNSLVFAVQTSSGKIKKPITLSLPYYNEQEITAAGERVVMFNYWMVAKAKFEVLDAKPIPGRISLAKIQTDKIFPQAEYVSLRLVHSPRLAKNSKVPKGFKLVPSSDRCLKIDGPRMTSPPGSPDPQFEASFSNTCDYPVQASGCENKNGAKGCALPKAIVMPPHSSNMLTLAGFSTKDVANIGACRVSLADGTPVTYDVILSSAPSASTFCLIKSTEN